MKTTSSCTVFTALLALLFGLMAPTSPAATVGISWAAPQSNVDGTPLSDLAGHHVYCGTTSGQYDMSVDVGMETNHVFGGLQPGATYYFAATAYDESGQESQFSQELELSLPELDAELAISPSQLSQTVVQGNGAESQFIEIWNAGEETLTYQVTDDVPWLSVMPDEGTVGQDYDTAEVTYTTASLAPGEYTGVITVTAPDANASPQTIGVTLLVELAGNPGPGDGEELDERRPDFGWQPVAGATWYQILLSKDGKTFHKEWVNQSLATWSPDFDMPGGDYEWWVRAWGPGIGTRPWSQGAEFAINVCVPGQVQLEHVGEGVEDDACEYTWTHDECATWYKLYVSRGGDAWHTRWYRAEEGQEFSVALADHPLGNFKWWVRPWGPDGFGPWSDSSSFSRGKAETEDIDESLPVGPVDLAWDAASCANAEWFHVWVCRNGSTYWHGWVHRDETVGDAGNLAVELEGELPFGEYTWWVLTWAPGGTGPWSVPATFEVGTPVPVGAEGAQDGAGIDMWWDEGTAQGATWYQVQVDIDGQRAWEGWLSLDDLGAEGSLRGATIPIPLVVGELAWRVRAWADDGLGAWSEDYVVAVR